MPVLRAENGKLELPESTDNWRGDFTFIQAADCQLGMTWTCGGKWGYGLGNGYDVPNYESDCSWEPEKRWCSSLVIMTNSMETKPKFVIMCGDLLDSWPHKGDIWLRVRDKQYADFQKIFSKLEVPLVCVCGNHDVGNSPTQKTVAKYRTDFGDDWFSFVCDGVFCIVINSQYHEDSTHVPDIATQQENWLEEQLGIVRSGRYKHSLPVSYTHLTLPTIYSV